MRKLKTAALAGVAAIAVSLSMWGAVDVPPAAAATCVKKAGLGTGGDDASASFQAWEAVLQATDWGMWSTWISSNQKVGTAPGYKVSGVAKSCKAGGLGRECKMQATLCK